MAFQCESCCQRSLLRVGMVPRLGGRDLPDRPERASVVEPVHPLEGGKLDGLEAAPRAAAADEFGLNTPIMLSASALYRPAGVAFGP